MLIGCALCVPLLAAAAPADERAALDRLRERIGALQSQIRATAGEQTALNTQLETAERRIGDIARRLRALEGELETQRVRLAELRRDEDRQREALAGEREALIRQIRSAYAMGRQERLKILLNQQDPARVSRLLTYYDYLNRARARRMAHLERRVSRLQDTRAAIGREEARLRELAASELGEQEELQRQQEARKHVLRRLAADLQGQERELAALERDELRLERLLAGIEQALADIPERSPSDERFEGGRGRLSWPARGVIEAEYGAPRVGGLRWDGVIIGAAEGAEVRAVHHGRVAFADWLRGFGLLLIIDHGDGWMSLYGHNQSLFKEVGDWVRAEEPVALTGSSGGRETPGVDFGIRHQGQPVDPLRWCRRPNGRRVG
ncbi:MAG: peptidoglycan DD-metalloendopeptidase family protein [Gammaproteobacteria bacterium]